MDEKGTKKWRRGRGAQGRKLYMVVIDHFSILPALSVPKEGLSEAVVWGRLGRVLCYIGGTRPVIAGEKKIYKVYDSNQSGLASMYIQQLFSLLFSHSLRVVSMRG